MCVYRHISREMYYPMPNSAAVKGLEFFLSFSRGCMVPYGVWWGERGCGGRGKGGKGRMFLGLDS